MDEGSQIQEVVRKSIDVTSCQMGLPAGHTVEPAPNERHCFSSPKGGVSPEASSTASDSPTPTNSAATHWHGLVCEEQRQLLGTEEESSDRHSSEDDGGENEDDGEGGDVWKITQEQREYYSAQFRSLQPDPMGLVAGPVARLFFEKSRLPVLELRKIWMLADVSKDGALSLGEFHTAMHLVVLRRNKIELPDTLPPSLVPLPCLSLASSILPPPAAPQHINTSTAVPAQQPHPKAVGPQTAHHEDSPPSLSPPAGDTSSTPQSKEWTKFVDSPTSSVSSPGPKPVNFDFHKAAVEQDPKILHPVPLRITPDSQALPSGNDEEAGLSSAVPPRSPRKTVDAIGQEHAPGFSNVSASAGNSTSVISAPSERTSPKKGSAAVTSLDSGEIRPIQRPQPKKYAVPGPGAIPPPPITSTILSNATDFNNLGVSNSGPGSLPVTMGSNVGVMKSQGLKKEPPPPPPPRPIRAHTRSSSLDLNHLGNSESLIAPPVVPPRISPCMPGFADFAHFGDEEEAEEEGEEAVEDEEEEEEEEEEDAEGVGSDGGGGEEGGGVGGGGGGGGGIGAGEEESGREGPPTDGALPEGGHSPTHHVHTTHGAFQVYRKPVKVSRSGKNLETSAGWSEAQRQRHRSDPSEMLTSRIPDLHNQSGWTTGCLNDSLINAYRESNSALSKLCAELSHELSVARHVRLALEMKMEGSQDQFLS